MFLKRYRRKRPPSIGWDLEPPCYHRSTWAGLICVPVHTTTECHTVRKHFETFLFFFFIFEKRVKGDDPEFCWTSTGPGHGCRFFCVCIRIDGGRMVPLIFGPMTVSDGKFKKEEKKKREKFLSRNLFSIFFFKKKRFWRARLSRSTILTDM
jgi:hypothetical protein